MKVFTTKDRENIHKRLDEVLDKISKSNYLIEPLEGLHIEITVFNGGNRRIIRKIDMAALEQPIENQLWEE